MSDREPQTNWGRWGDADEVGAVNLITAGKVVQAARLVRSGQTISLSRPFPKVTSDNNPYPAQHYMRVDDSAVTDFIGVDYHGDTATHVDGLCHILDDQGRVWNGRRASEVVKVSGTIWAGIENWRHGILTRGVLLDVPRFRGTDYVDIDRPVTGRELSEIARKQQTHLEAGDAVVVYCGRESWERERGGWGSEHDSRGRQRAPGLAADCRDFLREVDCAVLCWDMMDEMPWPDDRIDQAVHGANNYLGVALVDNCDLALLARECRARENFEFLLVVAPLHVAGGTGSPVNPLAVL